jgi:ATP-binding cassette subfamily F protein 3
MLRLDDLTLRIAGRPLIEHATVAVPERARVGVVGRNGAGKTTLFAAIAGDIQPDDGSIVLPRGMRIGRVAQEAPSGPESLVEAVLAADTERARLLALAETARDPAEIAEIQTRLADIGAHAAPARAARILAGLGFDAAAQGRPCASFSGGWRMRVALAATLFAEPDLLLLDEPSNHLDLEGTLWLQDYLARYPRTVILISHDRDLLDGACDHILHLAERRLTLHRGNYTIFDRRRRERLVLDLKLKKKQDAERDRLAAFVERFRAKATKARQAQSRLKRLEKMEPVAVAAEEAVQPFDIPAPAKALAPPLIVLDKAAAGYGERIVLDRLSLTLAPDDRIALLGQNGNGKTTLARLLAGTLQPAKGAVRRSDRLVAGYFAQHQLDLLVAEETPYQHVRHRLPDAAEAAVRARTARIGFSAERADVAVGHLSGGEKARLAFGLATFDGPHLLILDEPTNHLDIDSRAALVEALNDFPGAVVLVSHDRHLVELVADRLWLVADGTARPFDGDLDDYRRLVLAPDEAQRSGAEARPSRSDERRLAAARRAELAPLRARIKAAEAAIARCERTIAELDAALARPDAFSAEPARGAALAKERAAAMAALAAAEEDWLAASAAYEDANAA